MTKLSSLQGNIPTNVVSETNISDFKASPTFATINVAIAFIIWTYSLFSDCEEFETFENLSKIYQNLATIQALYFILSSIYFLKAFKNRHDEKIFSIYNSTISKIQKETEINEMADQLADKKKVFFFETPLLLWALVPVFLLCTIFSINFNTSAGGKLFDHKSMRRLPIFLAFGSLACFAVNIVNALKKSECTISLFSIYKSEYNLIFVCQYILLFGALLQNSFLFKKLSALSKN